MPYLGGYRDGLVKWVRGRYDFAVDGGAIGVFDLTLPVAVPADAIIVSGVVQVDAVPTSDGPAVIEVKVEDAGVLLAATEISGEPWSTVGRKNLIPDGTGASSIKTVGACTLRAVVSGAELTGGAFDVVIEFYENII